MSETILKPQPRISLLTKPFWDAVSESETLLIQQCQNASCGNYNFYPRVSCPYCHAGQLGWVKASGAGKVITNTTIHRPHHDGFNAECPYVFAAIELTEGPCIYGKIINAPIDQSLIGRQVSVAFEQHGPDQKIPVFTLID